MDGPKELVDKDGLVSKPYRQVAEKLLARM